MDLVKRITELCTERNMSFYRLSDLACLTQSTLTSIMSGKSSTTTISTIEKICEGFGITLAQFFAEETTLDIPPQAWGELEEFKKYLRFKYSSVDNENSDPPVCNNDDIIP